MSSLNSRSVSDTIFYFALAFLIYMPLHVFIVQSASLLTGGLEIWKAAKDVLLFVIIPFLLYMSYRRGLFQDKTFRWLVILAALYGLLHGLFLVLDKGDDTHSALVGSVYNTRLFGFMLLGYLVGTSKEAGKHTRYLLTAAIFIAFIVALFGVMQYFLPKDTLEHAGYTLERGVKPLFFIDDKPDLPRIMSTLKDPNSLGAYLIIPILLTGLSCMKQGANRAFFVRPLRREVLGIMCVVMIAALFLTFSRGALAGLAISSVTILFIVTGDRALSFIKKNAIFMIILLLLFLGGLILLKDNYIVQNTIFHADESTIEADPNEKRLAFSQQALDKIAEVPQGHGPGTAGLVSITNPKGGFLTENYYLQVAYEVGWLGIIIFVTILSIVMVKLFNLSAIKGEERFLPAVLFSALLAYLFYSLLIHLWSNEAVALQWWLLAGVSLGFTAFKNRSKPT